MYKFTELDKTTSVSGTAGSVYTQSIVFNVTVKRPTEKYFIPVKCRWCSVEEITITNDTNYEIIVNIKMDCLYTTGALGTTGFVIYR